MRDRDLSEKQPAWTETDSAQETEPDEVSPAAPSQPPPSSQVELGHVLVGLKMAREQRPVPTWSSYRWGLQDLIRAVQNIELTRGDSVRGRSLRDLTRQRIAGIESEAEIIRKCIMIPAMRNNFVRDLESCAFRLQKLLA